MYVVYINLLYFLSIFLYTYYKNLLSPKKYRYNPCYVSLIGKTPWAIDLFTTNNNNNNNMYLKSSIQTNSIDSNRSIHIAVTIDLFLRPCLCYQLQSIEQNMYVLL